MRIAFHGKGGAGKTTTTAGFVKYVSKLHPFVLAVDADLNTHLQAALGHPGDAKFLGQHFENITTYLKGSRRDIGDRPILATLPPAMKSNFIRVSPQDPFIRKYALMNANVALLTVGKYEQRDVGTTCYHEKLKSLMGVFHHMLDGEKDVIIVDTIAGTDNIATSLSFAYDLNVFVVEPTLKSVKVYDDYVALIPQYRDRLYVVGNKVMDESDRRFLQERIPQNVFLGALPFSNELKRCEQGDPASHEEFALQQEPVFARVYAMLMSRKRDWQQYLELLRKTYKWDCERWYSDFYKCDLLEGVDDQFVYANVLGAVNAGQPEFSNV